MCALVGAGGQGVSVGTLHETAPVAATLRLFFALVPGLLVTTEALAVPGPSITHKKEMVYRCL